MVEFESYYSFAADQVECVRTSKGESKTHPFILTVYLKSGRELTVSYTKQKDRDEAKRILLNRISYELQSNYEKLYNKLYSLDDAVKRIDKRQLRIWRQLKALLHLDKEGDEP